MKRFDIYIDGSHLDKQHNGRLGIGGVLVDLSGPGMGKLINEFSIELSPEYMNLTFGAEKHCRLWQEYIFFHISLH